MIVSGCTLLMLVAVDLCNVAAKSVANVGVLNSQISQLDVVGNGLSLILDCHLFIYLFIYLCIYIVTLGMIYFSAGTREVVL